MKRLLVAAGFALIIHGALLGLKVDWLQSTSQPVKKSEPLSLTLSYKYPEKPIVPEPVTPLIINKTPEKIPERKIIEKIPERVIDKPVKKAPLPVKKSELLKSEPEIIPPIIPTPPEPVESIELPDPKSDYQPEQPIRIEEDINQEIRNTVSDRVFRKGSRSVTLPPSPPPVKKAYPVYNRNPPPKYPRTAKRRGYEGTVVLNVFVDNTGMVRDLNIAKSSGHKILDKTAMSSVKVWLFEPGKRGDERIEMWVKVPIKFELK